MEARIVLPAAAGLAMVLGLGLSALVPTVMVQAAPPPLLDSTSSQHRDYGRSGSFQFTQSAPVDLDPDLTVGPQYVLGDDVMGFSAPVEAIEPEVVDAKPDFVAIDYGVPSRSEPRDDKPVPAPEAIKRHEAFVAAIY